MIGRFLLRVFLGLILLMLFRLMITANVFMWGYIDFMPALILNTVSFGFIIYVSLQYIISWIPRRRNK